MKRSRGFTLIELLVVMAIVSALLSIVVPRYIHKVDVAKEAALRENLGALRIALDQYYSDKGVYPEKLTDLVVQRYLRAMPLDPVTDQRDSWLPMIREEDAGKKVVYDVRSGAAGNAIDGTPFKSW
ncbi:MULTISPECIES: type II secretion system protein [Ralstonia]|uniref:Type II secretion system GspH family protein n=1 Tax=Ralstonia pickettii TaxID=329 RepID=A0AAW4QF19_RALPI|nr:MULTISPECIES: prepilin-type N-terminal cleavage/methylation domain-containing protein [Ralstonia]MBA9848513.1 prepilin-type N-terminal cleavage/methylation domain-containing protein [Ralstonia pickettii]MBA9853996.1 prepilin-type N-terminal cleavage/methylation domain-containing protein [Ralstonia pickettii]MBA9921628.1 prepilin-type N-terminal cleavage/methylation domain-containing protein [Ralstonia pickettii]MBA9960655.1 prepilin-type N-terminal cleavage/methylation domain-containing prot